MIKNKTLIIGQGFIGSYLAKELERIEPDVYDKYKNIDTRKHEDYDVAWLCLPTPYDTNEIDELLDAINTHKAYVYVIKSTVLPERIAEIVIKTNKRIVISPEYYGKTKDSDFDYDFTILGGDSKDCDLVIDSIKKCYNGNHRFIKTSQILASLVKYMFNAFLLTKQTFCNEFYNIANAYSVSYNDLRELFILDKRFTGIRTHADSTTQKLDHHCFSKDVPAIANVTDNDFLKFVVSKNVTHKKE